MGPTCEGFACPDGQELIGEDVVCATGHCCAKTCCKAIITTVTTTPLPTCEGFTCPAGQELIGDDVVCASGHCCAKTCCKAEVVTVTTTPAPLTCTSFTCPDGFHNLGAIECKNNHCCAHDCCAKDTTAAPPNPCTTIAPARKFDAKQSAFLQGATSPKKESSMMPAWGLPLFGVVAMFSLAAFFAMKVRRGHRSTRQLNFAQPVLQNDI